MRCGIVGFQEVLSANILKRVIDQSGIFVNAQILFAEGTVDNKVCCNIYGNHIM